MTTFETLAPTELLEVLIRDDEMPATPKQLVDAARLAQKVVRNCRRLRYRPEDPEILARVSAAWDGCVDGELHPFEDAAYLVCGIVQAPARTWARRSRETIAAAEALQ